MGLLDKGNIKQWRYKVSKLTFKFPGFGNLDINPNRVKYIQIIEDYTKNIFPILRMHVVLEPSTYYRVLKEKNGVQITLKMQKYYQKPDSATKYGPYDFLSDVFQLVMNDNTEDLLHAQKLSNNKSDYTRSARDDRNDLQQVDNTLEFFMFKMASLNAAKASNVNAILTKATVTDALAYLFSKTKLLNNVILGPPDNNTLYEYILLPPLSVLKSILYLDTYYGLYQTGSMIYFGIDYTYIIPYSANDRIYASSEKVRKIKIIVPSTDNVKDMTILGELSRSGENTYYIIADYRSVDIMNNSIANNYIEANDAQVVDSYTGEVNTNNSSATSIGGNFLRLLENKSENKFVGSTYTAQTSSDSIVVKFVLQDIDAKMITPNKEYSIEFDDAAYANKYKGTYLIVNSLQTYTNTGDGFYCTIEVTLKRTGFVKQ